MAALDVPEAAQGDNAVDERSCASPRTAVPPPPQPTAVIAPPLPAWPARDGCLYQRCYCEENIYWLARTLVQQLPALWRFFAVFISNPGKSVRGSSCWYWIMRSLLLTQSCVQEAFAEQPAPC